MIHVLTVHWKDPKWIPVQLKFLKRNLSRGYKTYAFLNYIEKEFHGQFDYELDEEIQSHAIKLNLLAQIASANAQSDDDILMFIDGDAFPIQPITNYIQSALKDNKLVAVQRKENDHITTKKTFYPSAQRKTIRKEQQSSII